MSNKMVKILSRKTIKPTKPTNKHHKTYNLSLRDQRIPAIYGKMVLFYNSDTNQTGNNILSNFTEKSQSLQKSLSDTLVYYYPLAGRLNETCNTVECNDEGAYFIEAEIECRLQNFLIQPDINLLKEFIPTFDPNFLSGCTLAVQFTLFNCGGIAISVCTSHKIGDGLSLCTFVKSWTELNRNSEKIKIPFPTLVQASFMPGRELLSLPELKDSSGKFTTKRFVFHAEKIANLKEKFGTGQQQCLITKVDVVLSCILKSAISASRSLHENISKHILLFHMVNLRKRVVPPFPENAIGNISWPVPILLEAKEEENISEIGCTIRRSLIEFYNSNGKIDFKEKLEDIVSQNDSTSLCNFPLYETDFGWGRPSWVASPSNIRNQIVMLDRKDGDGIETWVSLDENEMVKFQNDSAILAFASLNPSAFVTNCRM